MPVFKEAAAGDGLFWGQNLLHEKLGDKTQSLNIIIFLRSDFFFFFLLSWGVRQKKYVVMHVEIWKTGNWVQQQ